MKKVFLSIISIFTLFLCMTTLAFAEDWEPNLYFADPLPEIQSQKAKDFIKTNGTYLSGTDDFSLYFLRAAEINGDSVNNNESNCLVAIFYKNASGYITAHGSSGSAGQINYSVLNVQDPAILLNFTSYGCINSVVISLKGNQFIASSVNSVPNIGFHGDCEQFNSYMGIPYKFCYLQGKKILNENETEIVMTNMNQSSDNYTYNHIFNILGIEDAASKEEVYFQTYITDDNLRLRTANTKSSTVIKLLSKGTQVRVINIDPAMTKMEDKNGFWVLVQTDDKDVGWLWSDYLNRFDFDFK